MADRTEYTSVQMFDSDYETEPIDSGCRPFSFRKRVSLPQFLGIVLSGGLLLVVVTLFIISTKVNGIRTPYKSSPCTSPIIRREWRTLAKHEKEEYFRAVNCLRTKPSRLGSGHSLYDDFGYVHIRTGEDIHEAAGFLAWHRYFIHLYEEALKEECQYEGHLAYWNWELDWQDIAQAPVWDSEEGFGGDGKGARGVGKGHCVTDGPFANMTLFYFDTTEIEHCFARGFRQGEMKEEGVTSKLRPELLQETFDQQDYMSFNNKLELGAHAAIPAFIQGDSYSFTAPNDPIFFLHHTQLDRLWWQWQHIDPPRRLEAYNGPAGPGKEASIKDLLYVNALGPSVPVAEILSTETHLLCYAY